MRFSTPQEVRDWADAAVAYQLNCPDTDPNPYSTHCRRYDWQRGFEGQPARPFEGTLDYDLAYQRGAAYARHLVKK